MNAPGPNGRYDRPEKLGLVDSYCYDDFTERVRYVCLTAKSYPTTHVGGGANYDVHLLRVAIDSDGNKFWNRLVDSGKTSGLDNDVAIETLVTPEGKIAWAGFLQLLSTVGPYEDPVT